MLYCFLNGCEVWTKSFILAEQTSLCFQKFFTSSDVTPYIAYLIPQGVSWGSVLGIDQPLSVLGDLKYRNIGLYWNVGLTRHPN